MARNPVLSLVLVILVYSSASVMGRELLCDTDLAHIKTKLLCTETDITLMHSQDEALSQRIRQVLVRNVDHLRTKGRQILNYQLLLQT